MSWDRDAFKHAYVAAGGSPRSAASYVSYLNRAEQVLGTLAPLHDAAGAATLVDRAAQLPDATWGGTRQRRDSMAAVRRYAHLALAGFAPSPTSTCAASPPPSVRGVAEQLNDMVAEMRDLHGRYRALTGKPLGVTGEVAELTAAKLLGLDLCAARTAGYDAMANGRRVQIKGRAVSEGNRYRGRCPAIKCGGLFDLVVLVLLDRDTLLPLEIWEADEDAVAAKLRVPGSRARNERASLAIAQFRAIARCVWRHT